MSGEHPKRKIALSKGIVNLEDQYLNSMVMDVRTSKNPTPTPTPTPTPPRKSSNIPLVEARKLDYCLSFSGGHGKRMFRYFTLESLFLLFCLTASLLILPLILPPLPPPPFMLLLLPICILALLMVLAFMPCNVRDVTYTYV